MHSPRPILKIPPSPTLTATTPLPFPSARVSDSLHVHFPPTPTMTQTEITHSSFSYDRKPIVVLPNSCALPARGERAMDAIPDADCDLEVWALVHRKRRAAKGAYFHPRAYDSFEFDVAEGDQPEQLSSSLLFARDSSSLSSAYRVPNDTLLRDTHTRTQSHVRSVQLVGTVDASDTESDSSTTGNFHLNGAIDACQFIQNIPHMDLSLPFLQPKERMRKKREISLSPKKKTTTTTTTRTESTNPFERTRQVVRNAAACGSFTSGVYDSGLDGCLGGF